MRKMWNLIEGVERVCRPKRIVVCDGTETDRERLTDGMVRDRKLLPLNRRARPNSFLHRSNPNDVARTENDTFICTEKKEDAGPTNHWMDPREARRRVDPLFKGAMRGRTMYVIPYCAGPAGSPYARYGVQVTDSPYAALSLDGIMTRIAPETLNMEEDNTVFGPHSVGTLDPKNRYILHFPEENFIISINSGYGGNALLPKKCHGLRLASWAGRREGWLAEHMMIAGVERPDGKVFYIAGAFPSSCGKTNLAMLSPSLPGYKVWTVSDDLCWMHVGSDGRLWAINPEAGFFAVAPGTSPQSNPNMIATVARNTIFTNVGLAPGRMPWWEGLSDAPPAGVRDWRGRPWGGDDSVAHKNARFTVSARQCPTLSPHWEDPQGVPISAILFGGRRPDTVPLVAEAFSWEHGVYMGATLRSETTAAATGDIGVLRRDPFAMLPFCGYNMADYFGHWFTVGRRLTNPPHIFTVNWFRRGAGGKFLWDGFGENIRVLDWIIERVNGKGDAEETPVGFVPSALDLEGSRMSRSSLKEATTVKRDDWKSETASVQEFFETFGDRMPPELWQEHAALSARLR